MFAEKYNFEKLNTEKESRFLQKGEYIYLRNGISVETDLNNKGSVQNIIGNSQVADTFTSAGKIVGEYEDKERNRTIFFRYASDSNHGIYELDENDTINKVIEWSGLNFTTDTRVEGIAVIGEILIWCDDVENIRKINIERGKISNSLIQESFDGAGTQSLDTSKMIAPREYIIRTNNDNLSSQNSVTITSGSDNIAFDIPAGASQDYKFTWASSSDEVIVTHTTDATFTIRESLGYPLPLEEEFITLIKRPPALPLVVGRLRYERDTLTRECAMTTDLDSIFHQFANHNITVQPDGAILTSVPDDFHENYTRKKGHINEIPAGLTVTHDVETLPDPSAYQYYYSIVNTLDRSDPLVMAGLPVGSSGRQDDLASVNAMRRYETVVENTEHLFSQGFKMALEIIDKIPTLKDAVGLSEKDMDDDYQIEVQLRASDPIEADRKITLGDRLWAKGNGSISLERFHTEFQGMTQAESDKEIAKMLADKVTLYNPDVAEVMGMDFAEEAGMQKWLDRVKERRMTTQTQRQALQEQPSQSGQERTQGEVKTPLGREMVDMALGSKGARRPPAR